MSLSARLRAAVQAVAPIEDVSIGSLADRSTWRVQPSSLQAQAQPVIDAYAPPTAEQLLDEDAARDLDARALKALLLEIYPYLGAGKPTLAKLRLDIIARYRSLP